MEVKVSPKGAWIDGKGRLRIVKEFISEQEVSFEVEDDNGKDTET